MANRTRVYRASVQASNYQRTRVYQAGLVATPPPKIVTHRTRIYRLELKTVIPPSDYVWTGSSWKTALELVWNGSTWT